MPSRGNLLPTLRAFLLVLPVVILYAFCAKFMQTILDIERSREDIRTDLAEQTLFQVVE